MDETSTKLSFLASCRVSARSMHALAMRHVIGLYGRENIGFLWVFVEPALLCIGVMIVWRLLKGEDDHGISLVAMVLSGYMPLTLWRHMTNGGVFIYKSSKHILIHKNITFIDVVISRFTLEFLTTTMAAAFLYFFLTQFEIISPANDFGTVIIGWLIMAALSFGFGLTIAAACEQNEIIAHFIQPIQYISLPISGSFFMIDWIPSKYQYYISYIPLVHSYETIRSGLFGPSITTHADIFYPFFWAIIMSAIGLIWLEKIRDHIQQ